MSINANELIEVFSSFADNEADVELGSDGTLLYQRFGKMKTCKIREDEDGRILINDEDSGELPYRRYVALKLGQLDVFAQKLLEDRTSESAFVDGHARLSSVHEADAEDLGTKLLDAQCRNLNPFSSRLIFITADAGHGKTALLRQYQFDTAFNFNKGNCSFLFWHVDLQGRQLVRLSEALMGDLGELRMTGLYMPSVLTLIRMRLLVLAIDGFDELAAEQGTTDALGSLRAMLEQMQGRGAIVAASRRTFFNTDNYTRRAKLVNPLGHSRATEFNEIRLLPWQKEKATEFLEKVEVDNQKFPSGSETYHQILHELGNNEGHPILTTPFLLNHVAKGILRYDSSPQEFVGGMIDPIHGVPAVVEAFVQREVSDKWKNKETGEPYLSVEQHMLLLAAVAEELWQNQVDRLSADVIEAIASILLDDWGVEQDRQVQVYEMVKMHVMLHRPTDAKTDVRGFEHPEFQNYFLARSINGYIDSYVKGDGNLDRLRETLSVGQIPDSVARYTAMFGRESADILKVISGFTELADHEWRPTHLQSNVGTFLPYLLDKLQHPETIQVSGKLVFSSVIFEGLEIENVEFEDCTFLQTRMTDVTWKNVTLRNCKLYEVAFDRDSTYTNVKLIDCIVEGATLLVDGNEVFRAFADDRISHVISQCGIELQNSAGDGPTARERNETNKLTTKLLRIFSRTTTISEDVVRMRFSQQSHDILKQVIPLMEKHNQLTEVEWKGSGSKKAWQLRRPVDDILRDDNGGDSSEGERFWAEVNNA